MALLTISGSPHVHGTQTTQKIMWSVVVAMLPAFLAAIYYFGIPALMVTLVSVASCMFFEWVIGKYLLHTENTVTDGSAVVTGMLLAFNLPSNVPLWMVIIGALVAMGVGKMTFGGLGKNPFNPALVGRVFMFLSFPTAVALSEWPLPKPLFGSCAVTDAVSGPTTLNLMSHGGDLPALSDLFLGATGGAFGEVSALAVIIGGIYMLYKKVITWHIPVAFLGTAFVFAGLLWLIDPSQYANPLYHLFAGGMMLGAVFMATDMVTSPVTHKGQLIFGAGCGLLTIVFRCFGPMPEGVSFAILIMNAVTPLINKFIKTDKFGYQKTR
ncbi:MAG: RnfABCDGE type electron transport complex subunit D [Bacteroidales bacterium]|nr:RnfABCDGE type electron transport complex subunit D [Bacteroidales bacterium]